MNRLCSIFLALLLFGCSSGGGDGTAGDASPGLDTVQVDGGARDDAPSPTDSGPDTRSETVLALRYEIHYGTTDKWKGLALLDPAGRFHSETIGEGACRMHPPLSFLEQLEEAVEAAQPWDWGAAGLTGETCPPDSFRYVLHLEDLSQGKVMDSHWCGPDEDQVAGRAELIKKLQKLTAITNQDGDCSVMPRILATPIFAQSAGFDDGTGLVVAAARFQDPDYCLISYTILDPQIYRTNRTINLDQTTADAVAAGMIPVDSGDIPTTLGAICPEAAAFFATPAAMGDQGLETMVILAGPAGQDKPWSGWLATQGLSTVIPPGEGETDTSIHLTSLTFYRLIDPGTAGGHIDPNPWEEASLQSTAYTFVN